jgi:KipI family sensor histidine kinase inhibitor
MHKEIARPWTAVHRVGDAGLLLQFGTDLGEDSNDRVHQVAEAVLDAQFAGVVGVVPAFTTLLVEYDARRLTAEQLLEWLQVLPMGRSRPRSARTWDVPVLYGGNAGPDLEVAASQLGLRPDEVVSLHGAQIYRIYCIGFAPGFPLAGLLTPALRLPRRAIPRTRVYPGAVAIAGAQTGIYPLATPGGWHLIGRTPVVLFDWQDTPPCLYRPGDRLRFRAVSEEEYHALKASTSPVRLCEVRE